MIKSTRNGYCDHVQGIRNLSACVENSEELRWVVGCSMGGERWDGKEEEGETEEESVSSGGVYNSFYRWNHRRNVSVGDSAMSLYDYLSLNPSVIPSVKSFEKIVRRRYGRYIPLVFSGFLVVRFLFYDLFL